MLNNLARSVLLFSLLCSVTAAQTNPQASAPAWRTFTPEGREFSVEMPGVPEHRVERKPKPGIPGTFHLYHLIPETDTEVYVVGYIEMPSSEKNMDKRLESGLSYASGRFLSKGGKEISRRKTTSSFGCPGIIWIGSNPDIPVLEVRVFGTPGRVYLVMSASRYTEQASRDAASRFFDSFSVSGSPCEDKNRK